MNFPTIFFIFIIILFIYFHVNYQYKKSQDLEIYELDYKGIENLQEVCDIRQPVVFKFDSVIQKHAPINLDIISSIEKEDGNTLFLKDTNDYFKVDNSIINPTKVPVSFHSTLQLIKTENIASPHLFTEDNHEFIEETGFDSVMIKIGNTYLKPNYTINQTFDIMTASKGVELPMRYHTNTRKYIYVSTGKIMVKMAPFKNIKKLNFDTQLLVSPMNCWTPPPEYLTYINKIRFLEFDITKGHILYVPPYWIYSISYSDDNTCLLEYNYQTIMNVIAHPTDVICSLKNTGQSLINSFTSNSNNDEKKNNTKIQSASATASATASTMATTSASSSAMASTTTSAQLTSNSQTTYLENQSSQQDILPQYDLSVIKSSSSSTA